MRKRLLYLFWMAWAASQSAPAGETIHLKTRNLTADSYPAADALRAARQGPGHLLVQFAGVPRSADLQELRRRGARVVGSAPDGGVAISADRPISLDGLGVRWAGPLLPRDKLSPRLSAEAAGPDRSAVVVEFHPDVLARRALELLRGTNAQVLRNTNLAPNHLLVSATPSVLARIAQFDEVAYIFPASGDLIQGHRLTACAGAMMAQGPVGQYVKVGSGWGGAGPDGVVELDYVFAQMSAKLPPASAQSEIIQALQEWTKYANVRFVPGTGMAAGRTVSIMFAQGVHGDGYPFQPGSLVLAHTFFPAPPNPEPLAGDMHLNEDQNWRIGSDIDLYTVALHEAGHALGLGHTDDPSAVMYPYYRFGAVLSDDDIAGIRSLYGSPDTPAQPPASPLSLVISNPAWPAMTTTASSISISGSAAGGTGALQVAWSTDRGWSGHAAGSASWSIGSVPLNEGSNGITVRVTDSAGDSASASIVVTRHAAPVTPVTPPSTPTGPPPAGPPSLTVTSPALSIVSTSLAAITLSGTASAAVTLVNWTNSTGSSGEASGTASWSAAGIPLLVGANTITVRAYDGAGNSAWRSVTVVRR